MSQSLLQITSLSYSTPLKPLFKNLNLTVQSGDRIALIGKNGEGKTTLLNSICGQTKPDAGSVSVSGVISSVEQISDNNHSDQCVADQLTEKEVSFGHFIRTHKSIFSSPPPEHSMIVGNMSGGELTKYLIVLALLEKPDLLLLDEPTNHLDRKSIKELEVFLKSFQGAVLFTSHNREFLTTMVEKVWSLGSQTVQVFSGGYEAFITEQKQQLQAQSRQYEATKKEISSVRAGIEKRETRANRASKEGRQKKAEKSREKGAEDYFRNRSEKGIGKTKKKQDKSLDVLKVKLGALKEDSVKSVHVPFETINKSGAVLLDVFDLAVTIENKVLVTVPNFRLTVGDRVSITGENGSGKTSLLNKLMLEVEHKHTSLSIINGIAYVTQSYHQVDRGKTLIENLGGHSNDLDKERLFKQLGLFQFGKEYAHVHAAQLSGGETARLAFAIATLNPIDLLVLDEPTNNLDIETLDTIARALSGFRGAILVVSHDQSFLEEIGIDSEYQIENCILKKV